MGALVGGGVFAGGGVVGMRVGPDKWGFRWRETGGDVNTPGGGRQGGEARLTRILD